jgi:hypothetical protein
LPRRRELAPQQVRRRDQPPGILSTPQPLRPVGQRQRIVGPSHRQRPARGGQDGVAPRFQREQ